MIRQLADEAIIRRLIEVRGIGQWTVEMLLIFQLGRPDVLPVDDFGLRNGFRIAYRRPTMPTPKQLLQYGERWRPYRTAAAWYLWRAADREKRGMEVF
jgi:DNA-3-methyladenine glycosylase II